jgi:hypothetical protein
MLSDGGLIGFILIVTFLASVVYSAIVTHNYILLGGIVALMVHGMFFYTLAAFSYVPYMVLIASSMTASIAFPIPLAIGVLISIVLVRLIIVYLVKPQLALLWIAKAANTNDYVLQNKCIDKAVDYDPTNGAVLASAATIKSASDPWLGLFYSEMSLHFYDGLMRPAELWTKYGQLQARVGNVEGGKRALRYSLYLNPCYYPARDILQHIAKQEKEWKENNDKAAKALRDQQILNTLNPDRRATA